MQNENYIADLFRSIDTKDAASFAGFMAEDGVFIFANAEPVQGRPNVEKAVAGFFDSIKALNHNITDTWDTGDAVVVKGNVTYTRHDDSTLSVPFADILKMNGSEVQEYGIYMDISELYK